MPTIQALYPRYNGTDIYVDMCEKTMSRGTIIYEKCDAPKNYVDNVASKCIWMYEWFEIKFCEEKKYNPGIVFKSTHPILQ